MRSRAARLTSAALAVLALGGAALFVLFGERDIAARRDAVRAFDAAARDAVRDLTEARAAQQAYVASGQSSTFWIPKVAALAASAARNVDTLRQTAQSSDARKTLIDVDAAVTEFGNVDKRAREYIDAGEPLMAGDVMFSEGAQSSTEASVGVETARTAERYAFEADEAAIRGQQTYALAGAAGVTVLLLLVLALSGPGPAVDAAEQPVREAETLSIAAVPPKTLKDPPSPSVANRSPGSDRALALAAELCGAFGRVQSMADLERVVADIARAIDAPGVIVWLGNTSGADLRPIVTFGYSEKVVQLLGTVAVTADNGAAAAYRSGTMQVIPELPGVARGAVVAPLMSIDGCIGALAAEIRSGGESSAHVQSLATIFASQLAAVLATTAASRGTRAAR